MMWCEEHDIRCLKRAHSKSTKNAELSVNVLPEAQIVLTYHVTHSMCIAVHAQIIKRATLQRNCVTETSRNLQRRGE